MRGRWGLVVLLACTGCGAGGAAAPPDASGGADAAPKLDAPITTFEDRLRQAATGPLDLAVAGGRLTRLTGRVPLPAAAGADAEGQARWFLGEHKEAFGLADPLVDLAPAGVTSSAGASVVSFERVGGGRRVFLSGVDVHVTPAGEVIAVRAALPQRVDAPASPTLDAASAVQRAQAALAMHDAAPGAPELVIYDGALAGGPARTALAWRVGLRAADPPSAPVVLVDATDGTVLFAYDDLFDVRDRATYTARNQTDWELLLDGIWPDQWFNEAGPVVPSTVYDQQGADAHAHAKRIYDYYLATFDRDSWDGKGSPLRSYVHYHTKANNASWYEGALWLMDGIVALDVSAHEVTHGVVRSSAGLLYREQSGALNESFADVFAAFVSPDDAGKWTLAEGLTFGAKVGPLRDLADPTRHGQPRQMSAYSALGAGVAPAKANDWGGVHKNSGIPNHAAYLLTVGGTHADSHIEVCGIGQRKAEQIYYKALTRYLGPCPASKPCERSPSFDDLRWALRSACLEYALFTPGNPYGIEMRDCGAVLNALASVGIGTPDADNDGWPDDGDDCPNDYDPGQTGACAGGPRRCDGAPPGKVTVTTTHSQQAQRSGAELEFLFATDVAERPGPTTGSAVDVTTTYPAIYSTLTESFKVSRESTTTWVIEGSLTAQAQLTPITPQAPESATDAYMIIHVSVPIAVPARFGLSFECQAAGDVKDENAGSQGIDHLPTYVRVTTSSSFGLTIPQCSIGARLGDEETLKPPGWTLAATPTLSGLESTTGVETINLELYAETGAGQGPGYSYADVIRMTLTRLRITVL